MTRKHFIEIAADVANLTDEASRKQIARDLASTFKRINSNFDRQRFLDACNAS